MCVHACVHACVGGEGEWKRVGKRGRVRGWGEGEDEEGGGVGRRGWVEGGESRRMDSMERVGGVGVGGWGEGEDGERERMGRRRKVKGMGD